MSGIHALHQLPMRMDGVKAVLFSIAKRSSAGVSARVFNELTDPRSDGLSFVGLKPIEFLAYGGGLLWLPHSSCRILSLSASGKCRIILYVTALGA